MSAAIGLTHMDRAFFEVKEPVMYWFTITDREGSVLT
jgi:hypothetical protein